MLGRDLFNCPPLFLAPMEGLGDRAFRRAMAFIGGFDQACTEFLRIPLNPHILSLARAYQACEIAPYPLAVQLMGSQPVLMGLMAQEMEKKGAPRVDLNCGCPSNTVTGHGAGSSLLKDPQLLYEIAHSMVSAVAIPVTAKLRSGFEDLCLFEENLMATQSSGVAFITLHPRTKVEGYTPPARWDLIARAKSLLRIPVVGNGDIYCVQDALKMLKQTHCDALMIGRGAAINPWIFREIRCRFSGRVFQKKWSEQVQFLRIFIANLSAKMPLFNQIGKLKQLMSFQFKRTHSLLALRQAMLRQSYRDPEDFLEQVLPVLKEHWDGLFDS